MYSLVSNNLPKVGHGNTETSVFIVSFLVIAFWVLKHNEILIQSINSVNDNKVNKINSCFKW